MYFPTVEPFWKQNWNLIDAYIWEKIVFMLSELEASDGDVNVSEVNPRSCQVPC